MLDGKVLPAAAGTIGFDLNAPVTKASAAAYYAKGFRFCIRYVSRNDATRANNQDLTLAEGVTILGAGLGLMVVQHVAKPGWTPNGPLGQEYGSNAAKYALAAGLPKGVNLWLDLEGVKRGTPPDDIIAYCNAWFQEARAGGFEPGLYVGFDVWLSPEDLFLKLAVTHYWRADGKITDIAHRGYQLFQHTTNAGTPQEFDYDVVKADAFGGTPLVLFPS